MPRPGWRKRALAVPRAWPLADRPRAGAPSNRHRRRRRARRLRRRVRRRHRHGDGQPGPRGAGRRGGGGQSPGRQAHRPGSRQGPLPRAGGEANGLVQSQPSHRSPTGRRRPADFIPAGITENARVIRRQRPGITGGAAGKRRAMTTPPVPEPTPPEPIPPEPVPPVPGPAPPPGPGPAPAPPIPTPEPPDPTPPFPRLR